MWPHLHRAYVIGGCIFFWLAVPPNIIIRGKHDEMTNETNQFWVYGKINDPKKVTINRTNIPIFSPMPSWILFKSSVILLAKSEVVLVSYHPISWRRTASRNFKYMVNTRKYPLHGYILGVLTHTTTLDWHCRSDETLMWVLTYTAWLCLA